MTEKIICFKKFKNLDNKGRLDLWKHWIIFLIIEPASMSFLINNDILLFNYAS